MFVVLKHVYIPLLFFSGVDYIDAPTPYMMGLHSGVDTYGLVTVLQFLIDGDQDPGNKIPSLLLMW